MENRDFYDDIVDKRTISDSMKLREASPSVFVPPWILLWINYSFSVMNLN